MDTKRIRKFVVVVLVVFLAASVTQARPALSQSVAASSVNGRIAFVSGRDGNVEIYVMSADGTGVTRLTNNQVEDGGPAWSPDGQ